MTLFDDDHARILNIISALVSIALGSLALGGHLVSGARRLVAWIKELPKVTTRPTIVGTGAITLEPVSCSGYATVTLTSIIRPEGQVELRKIDGPRRFSD